MPVHKGGKRGRNLIKSAHNKQKGVYAKQRVRTEANKRKRRKSHLSRHPNDLQAQRILKELLV